MEMWTAYSKFLAPWARRGADGTHAVLADMRDGIRACRGQNIGNYIPFFTTALAEAEAQAGETEQALATIDGVIGDSERSGQRWFDAETHRIRGEILQKRDPAKTVPAEEALLTAVAIAQHQKAKSFELRAALSLAKHYQSSGYAADAHGVLAPAVEGFSPMPEFPEIAEAQALLAALADTNDVKTATASRQRRLKLQTSYGQALLWSKGFGAAETKAAFNRAKELGVGTAAAERFPVYYGLFIGGLLRGEFAAARQTAEIFLHEASKEERMTEVAVADRNLGMTCLLEGNFVEAQAHLERSLAICDSQRDREVKFHYGWDNSAGVPALLAPTIWLLGDVGRAREMMEEAVTRAALSRHEPTVANTHFLKALFEMLRGDATTVRIAAETVAELGRKLQLPVMVVEGDFTRSRE
jgi:tetratricopeptide (TPR) repeat protein